MPPLTATPNPLALPVLPAGSSPQQKKFGKLVRQIEALRASVARWREALPLHQQRCVRELNPLITAYRGELLAFVLFLEQQYLACELRRDQQARLGELITRLAQPLIDGDHSGEVQALLNRYLADPVPAHPPPPESAMPAPLAPPLPADEAIDWTDPDALEAHQQRLEAEREATRHSARQAAVQQRQAAARQRLASTEQAEAQQSVRSVFRKLASALHPDREADASERARKTALMQRVNVAYGRQDLLALLNLQLEAEQINTQHMATLADDRLRHYNRVLAEQVAELQRDLAECEDQVRQTHGLAPDQRLDPARLPTLLSRDRQALQQQITHLQHDRRFLADRQALKRWIKHQHAAAA